MASLEQVQQSSALDLQVNLNHLTTCAHHIRIQVDTQNRSFYAPKVKEKFVHMSKIDKNIWPVCFLYYLIY